MSLYDRADVPGYAIEYPNNCRCGPCTAVREYRERREFADLQARIAAAAEADHTPDWDYELPQEYQK